MFDDWRFRKVLMRLLMLRPYEQQQLAHDIIGEYPLALSPRYSPVMAAARLRYEVTGERQWMTILEL